jgi:deoxyribodipyrimidine photo-lyase
MSNELFESLQIAHTDAPRITERRAGEPRQGARCVVYWMQRSVRIADNPALDVAVAVGNALGLPVCVFFSVIPNYPNANLRHYRFLQQGLIEAAAEAEERGVGFVVRRPPDNSLEAFLEEVKAALVVGDENPLREPERWRRVLARKLKIPFWTVDADVVVPSQIFNRSYTLLHHFRPHLQRALSEFLVEPQNLKPLKAWKRPKGLAGFDLRNEITEGFAKLDRRVPPVDAFAGGEHSARKRLAEFASRELAAYEERRNDPSKTGTSRLSPYLHFGNISPVRIALEAAAAVRAGKAPESAKEKFLDELVGWRELAALFVRHEPKYDSWECAAPWARKTLLEHAGDARRRYSLEELERAQTHDDLWNAAQREMVATGWMHGYMRMYWAKQILAWAPDPERAFAWAVELNDRYQLDGRDPNSYAGVAWAIVGRHDRPWFNRPVFGLVRPMSGVALRKKFDTGAYIRRHGGGLF